MTLILALAVSPAVAANASGVRPHSVAAPLAIDATYGNGGTSGTTLSFTGLVAVDGSERRLLVGPSSVARMLPSGHLDDSYGTNGVAPIAFPSGFVAAQALVDNSGRLLVIGTDSGNNLVVVRMTNAGALDQTYGAEGVSVTTPPFSAVYTDQVIDAAVTPADGLTILERGLSVSSGATQDYLTRLTDVGALDSSFATNGSVSTQAYNVTSLVQAESSDVLFLDNDLSPARVSAITTTGTPDTNFGTAGTAQVTSSAGKLFGILQDGSGNLIIAGARDSGSDTYVTLTKTDSTGAVDTSFGASGTGSILTDDNCTDTNSIDEPQITPSGQIWVMHEQGCSTPTFPDFAVFTGAGAAVTSFAENGYWAPNSVGGYVTDPAAFQVLADGSVTVGANVGPANSTARHAGSLRLVPASRSAATPVSLAAARSDAAVYVRTSTVGWHSLGGKLLGPPAMVNVGGRIFSIGVGLDKNVFVRSATTAWTAMGPKRTKCLTPDAAYDASAHRIVVDCVGTNSGLFYATSAVPAAGKNPVLGHFAGLSGRLATGAGIWVDGTGTHFVGVGANGYSVWYRTPSQPWTRALIACSAQPAGLTAGGVGYLACEDHGVIAWQAGNAVHVSNTATGRVGLVPVSADGGRVQIVYDGPNRSVTGLTITGQGGGASMSYGGSTVGGVSAAGY